MMRALGPNLGGTEMASKFTVEQRTAIMSEARANVAELHAARANARRQGDPRPDILNSARDRDRRPVHCKMKR
jgi:hypothetical protein